MEIKKAEYKTEMAERRVMVSAAEYGCDHCQKKIEGDDRLEITVFREDDEDPGKHEFCSWRCVIDFIPSIESDDFAVLPYLYYRSSDPKTGIKGFLELFNTQ